MATPAVRETLANLTTTLGAPTAVFYSGGSILARFTPADEPSANERYVRFSSSFDAALSAMGATVDHKVDATACGRVPLVRAGRVGAVAFHAQGGSEPAGFTVRLFEAQRAGGSPLEAMLATEKAVDAALATAGDTRDALIGYLANKLMAEPVAGSQLASDLSRLVADYMRGAAHAQRSIVGG